MSNKVINIEGFEVHLDSWNQAVMRKVPGKALLQERIGVRRKVRATLAGSIWSFEGSSVRQVIRLIKDEIAERKQVFAKIGASA